MKQVFLPSMALYASLILDLFTGQHLYLYGWGREPFWFAVGTIVLASYLFMGDKSGRSLGMIALVLCCAWLVFYPAHNGWDCVLAPTLLFGIIFYIFKSRFNED